MKPILILMGKTNSGKSTIAKHLIDHYKFNNVITYTSRPKRDNEINGVDYYFVNKNIFTDKILKGDFIEYRKYNTLVDNVKNVWFYGLEKENNNIDLSKNNVLILTYDGALKVLQYFGYSKCEVVYIDVPNEILEKRAKQRCDYDPIEFKRRIKADNKDFNWNKIKGIVDKKIINVDKTIEEVCEEIIDEKNR